MVAREEIKERPETLVGTLISPRPHLLDKSLQDLRRVAVQDRANGSILGVILVVCMMLTGMARR